MAQLRSIALLVALGLAGAAVGAQKPAPPDPADTPAAPNAHEQGKAGETPQGSEAAESPKVVGLQVVSHTGQTLGSVIDVIVDDSKQPEYAVISTGNDTITAVPYRAVTAMIKDGKVVMDRSKLENSPQVAQIELHDKANSKWRADSDRYWNPATIREAQESPGTSNPTTTPRQRPKER
jgi:sporulation protein YlmC with PRC-barrel domain